MSLRTLCQKNTEWTMGVLSVTLVMREVGTRPSSIHLGCHQPEFIFSTRFDNPFLIYQRIHGESSLLQLNSIADQNQFQSTIQIFTNSDHAISYINIKPSPAKPNHCTQNNHHRHDVFINFDERCGTNAFAKGFPRRATKRHHTRHHQNRFRDH